MEQLTPEFYQHVAICTVLIILFALALWTWKKKSKTIERDISSSFAQLKACIMCSENKKQLGYYKIRVEHFFDKYHGKVSKPFLQRYYARLLESIAFKENQFDEPAKKVPA